jgi:hypothetical protein
VAVSFIGGGKPEYLEKIIDLSIIIVFISFNQVGIQIFNEYQ